MKKDNPALFSKKAREILMHKAHSISQNDFELAQNCGFFVNDNGTLEGWIDSMSIICNEQIKQPSRILFLDFETNTLNGYAVSAGMVLMHMDGLNNVSKIEDKYFLINPKAAIDEGAKKVHNISEKDVSSAPTFEDLYQSNQISWIFEADMIVAYNAIYDIGVLINEMQRMGIPFPSYIRFLDMMSRIKEIVRAKSKTGRKKDAKLSEAASFFGISYQSADLHNSLEDTKLLVSVFLEAVRYCVDITKV